MTGVDRCGKEIVGIDLPEGCLSTEFNLRTVLQGLLGMDDAIFFAHKNKRFPHNRIFYPLFLNEDGTAFIMAEIGENFLVT